MKCLCCGKDIDKNGENGWHKSCIKRFFGASKLPEIEIDDETLKKLADETVNNGLTVPGVQKKLSLHLISENKSPKLTIVNFPTGYILKPQVPQYETLPEAEHLVMSMADITGISTVPHALIGNNGNYAYITNNACKTWIPYEIDNLKGSNYVNGVSIQKDDKRNIWVLTLQIATNHELKTVIYTSNDLWKSWSKVQNSVQKAT